MTFIIICYISFFSISSLSSLHKTVEEGAVQSSLELGLVPPLASTTILGAPVKPDGIPKPPPTSIHAEVEPAPQDTYKQSATPTISGDSRTEFKHQTRLASHPEGNPFLAITDVEANNALEWTLPKAIVGGDVNLGKWRSGFDDCDETGADLQFVRHMSRYENRITICDDGPTVVECVLDSKDGKPTKGKSKRAPKTGLDPIVRFCFARNLYPPKTKDRSICLSNDQNEREGCSWTMYCRPTGFWKEQGGGSNAPMFRGLGNAFNWMASGTLRREEPEMVPDDGMSTSVEKTDRVLHYIAFGDCGGKWNPGHCMADPINFSAVQKILGYDNTNTYSYLLRGLNYDDLAGTAGDKTRPMFELWAALSKKAYPRKESYNAFPRNGPVSLVAFSPAPTTSAW